ncbi:hypothetical protein KP509_31G016600 [Ceratopteris richardii]|uniref:Uncharacterized protein n=1 Tax=Ceratopteris richardii TaxID=49495 RepID=A0A8T2QXJ5_CERRI|nr:hypothetical protein KP509_31G016600 [Ceratopteris richardii]
MVLHEALRDGLARASSNETRIVLNSMLNPVFEVGNSKQQPVGVNLNNVKVTKGQVCLNPNVLQQNQGELSYAKALQNQQQGFYSMFANQALPGMHVSHSIFNGYKGKEKILEDREIGSSPPKCEMEHTINLEPEIEDNWNNHLEEKVVIALCHGPRPAQEILKNCYQHVFCFCQ